MNESLRTVDGRHVLRMERRLGHPPEKVWRALTEPGQLRRWFPAEVRLDPRVGGEIRFGPEPEGTADEQGRADDTSVITEFDPPRLLAFGWGDELLRFEVSPDGPGGSILVLEHAFDIRSAGASYASGWQTCLGALDRLLAGRSADPEERPSAELHERYIRAFRLDEGTTESTSTGWQVRFDRQLTRPIGDVWHSLLGGGGSGSGLVAVGAPVPAGLASPRFRTTEITALTAPTMIEYGWRPDGPGPDDRTVGRIRWELRDGTGHGARLILVHTGPHELADHQESALAVWQARIARLAAPPSHPDDPPPGGSAA